MEDIEIKAQDDMIDSDEPANVDSVRHTTKYTGSKKPMNKAKRRRKGKMQRESRKANRSK